MKATTILFVARRLAQLVPVVLAIAALNFLLVKLAPGDAADILAGQMGHATLEFTEHGAKRTTSGGFTWTLSGDRTALRGSFWSTAADTSGRSTAVRMP